MKKRYIILPIVIIAVLAAIIISVAVALNQRYLKKLSYDHIDTRAYNGVEVVGEDGEFYLVKDGKRVSDGYASLQSVNDLYSQPLEELAATDAQIVLFDYYIARAKDDSEYLLVSSEGDEFAIAGENYSLDTEATALPYLVFTNNASGLKSVVSLYRLDSDISYRSGNELTLRTFREVEPVSVCPDEPLCAYLRVLEVSDDERVGYFRQDGIKLASCKDVSVLSLYKKNDDRAYPFFYEPETAKLTSLGGELIASNITSIVSAGADEWAYALCHNQENGVTYAVGFTPDRYFTVSSDTYVISDMVSFGNCLVAPRADGKGKDVINVTNAKTATYASVTDIGAALVAVGVDGEYLYLDENGSVLLTGTYGDMLPIAELSTDRCKVFASASYDAEKGSGFLHFARSGSEPYTLEVKDMTISALDAEDVAAYTLQRQTDGKSEYAILAPFSAAKLSAYYDNVTPCAQNGVYYVLAVSYRGGTYDVVDPLTAKAVSSFACTPEEMAKVSFSHVDNIALATDTRDKNTAVHISVVTLSKYESEHLLGGTRYFAVYRTAPSSDELSGAASLKVSEIGKDLLIDKPYKAFTADNYLVTYTATGSEVFSLDEYFELTRVASLPYHAVDILRDRTENGEYYFLVQTDSEMLGLYNTDSEAVLAPYYSRITHAENGYFVVGLRGAYGVIRSTANGTKTVVDFLYSEIVPLGDNGYLAVNGEGETTVYAGKKQMMSESVQSRKKILYYSLDDNGKLAVSEGALLSIDGNLYIHRSENHLALSFGRYEDCDGAVSGVLNKRAQALYYYDGAQLVHTQVVYPNEVFDGFYMYGESAEWYSSASAAEQITAVTPDDLSNRNIIKLYAKAK